MTISTIKLTGLIAGLLGAGIAIGIYIQNLNSEKGFISDKDVVKYGDVDKEDAVKMISAYTRTLTQAGTQRPTSETIKSVYFDLGELKKYVRTMEKRYGADGIRIYFGQYTTGIKDTTREIDKDPYSGRRDTTISLIGHNTVIIMPTIKDGNYHYDLLKDPKTKEEIVSFIQPYLKLSPYNGGVSCPPYPPKYCNPGQTLACLAEGGTEAMCDPRK